MVGSAARGARDSMRRPVAAPDRQVFRSQNRQGPSVRNLPATGVNHKESGRGETGARPSAQRCFASRDAAGGNTVYSGDVSTRTPLMSAQSHLQRDERLHRVRSGLRGASADRSVNGQTAELRGVNVGLRAEPGRATVPHRRSLPATNRPPRVLRCVGHWLYFGLDRIRPKPAE